MYAKFHFITQFESKVIKVNVRLVEKLKNTADLAVLAEKTFLQVKKILVTNFF